MANTELCVDLNVLYFPTLKYFSKNSYLDYDNAMTEKAMDWFMDTRDKLDMSTATPAIAYNTETEQYFVIKKPKRKLDFIGTLNEQLYLALPITIFCGISLLGCLMMLCLYLAKAVEDAEKEAMLRPAGVQAELGENVLLNTSQQTIPANYGMESRKADEYREALKVYRDGIRMEEIYD